jgi:hypothetical protein
MSSLEDEIIKQKGEEYARAINASLRKTMDDLFKKEYFKYHAPDYYSKRKYGKWTIYNKEGMRVAWGLNEKEMKNYMKLLKGEE